ncbi:MAG: hypothetical protein ACE145_00340 [Terriglobia bacterium]
MTNRRIFGSLMTGLAVLALVSASAFARGGRTISISYPATLGGVRLDAGRYELTYQQHSPEATVTLAKGKSVVVTTQGKVQDRSTKYQRDMVVFETKSDGTQVVSEIRLGGTHQAIVFNE